MDKSLTNKQIDILFTTICLIYSLGWFLLLKKVM